MNYHGRIQGVRMDTRSGTLETVRKSYSYKLALKSMLVISVGAAASTFIISFFLSRAPGSSYAESYTIIAELRRQLLDKVVAVYLVSSLFIGGGIGIIALLYSHRVAGPIHRLGMFAHSVGAGDLSRKVALRINDVVHPIADDFNDMVARYKNTILQLDREVEELRETVSETKGPSAGGDGDAYVSKGIVKKAEEINEILSHIRV
jgi:methyl-accepting chemotaxis protein